jgi:hypothetical protein
MCVVSGYYKNMITILMRNAAAATTPTGMVCIALSIGSAVMLAGNNVLVVVCYLITCYRITSRYAYRQRTSSVQSVVVCMRGDVVCVIRDGTVISASTQVSLVFDPEVKLRRARLQVVITMGDRVRKPRYYSLFCFFCFVRYDHEHVLDCSSYAYAALCSGDAFTILMPTWFFAIS